MKYIFQVEINASRRQVIELFDNSDNLPEWQDGFVNFEHLSGPFNELGAKNRLKYIANGMPITITETVTTKNLPDEHSGLYDSKLMTTIMTNQFEEIAANKTRYTAILEITKLKGMMVKMMAGTFTAVVEKQTERWVNQFRDFVEKSV